MSVKILSVIIPSYNMEAYLPKCCDSLLIQDKTLFDKLDIIIVNDGSKDRTSEIAHSYESRFPGVFHVIDKPNGHYGSCVNAALPKVCGEFVKMLDADDYYDTSSFEEYVRALVSLTANSTLPDLVINDTDIVDDRGIVTSSFKYDIPSECLLLNGEWASTTADLINPSIAFKTLNVLSSGYKQTEGCLNTDNEWVFKGMEHVRTAFFIDYPLYKYFVGREGQSSSNDVKRRFAHQHMEVTDRLLDEYEKCKDSVPPEVCLFLRKYLRRLYNFSLSDFVKWPFDKKNRVFYEVDRKFSKIMPEARHELGEKYKVFGNRVRSFHYITAWQNWQICRSWPIRFAKWYTAFRYEISKTICARHKN